uniref:Immunoglobulin V-set domain-containing protein n=1 Tax=Nothobranchius furzeri TaxID=105023 RepID=A0A8C6KWM9_NOTFU
MYQCNLMFSSLYVPGISLCLEVRQSHSDLITKPGKKVEIFCSHDKTDFWIMLWYQRSPGDTAMNLVGYIYNKAVTLEYKTDFNISGDLKTKLMSNTCLCGCFGSLSEKCTFFYSLTGKIQTILK